LEDTIRLLKAVQSDLELAESKHDESHQTLVGGCAAFDDAKRRAAAESSGRLATLAARLTSEAAAEAATDAELKHIKKERLDAKETTDKTTEMREKEREEAETRVADNEKQLQMLEAGLKVILDTKKAMEMEAEAKASNQMAAAKAAVGQGPAPEEGEAGASLLAQQQAVAYMVDSIRASKKMPSLGLLASAEAASSSGFDMVIGTIKNMIDNAEADMKKTGEEMVVKDKDYADLLQTIKQNRLTLRTQDYTLRERLVNASLSLVITRSEQEILEFMHKFSLQVGALIVGIPEDGQHSLCEDEADWAKGYKENVGEVESRVSQALEFIEALPPIKDDRTGDLAPGSSPAAAPETSSFMLHAAVPATVPKAPVAATALKLASPQAGGAARASQGTLADAAHDEEEVESEMLVANKTAGQLAWRSSRNVLVQSRSRMNSTASLSSLIDRFLQSPEDGEQEEPRVLAAAMSLETLVPNSSAVFRVGQALKTRTPKADVALLQHLHAALSDHWNYLLSEVDEEEDCASRKARTWTELKAAQKKEVAARARMLESRAMLKEAETKLAELVPYLEQFKMDQESVAGGGQMMTDLHAMATSAIDHAHDTLDKAESQSKPYVENRKAPAEAVSVPVYMKKVRDSIDGTNAFHTKKIKVLDAVVADLKVKLEDMVATLEDEQVKLEKARDNAQGLYDEDKKAVEDAVQEEKDATAALDAAEKDCEGILLSLSTRRKRTKMELWAVDFALHLVDPTANTMII